MSRNNRKLEQVHNILRYWSYLTQPMEHLCLLCSKKYKLEFELENFVREVESVERSRRRALQASAKALGQEQAWHV